MLECEYLPSGAACFNAGWKLALMQMHVKEDRHHDRQTAMFSRDLQQTPLLN